MKVAALYDIHGNLPALEAVMEDIQQSGVDRIVVGGDIVLGPMSAACIDLVLKQEIPVHFIQGNCEQFVLNEIDGGPPHSVPDTVKKKIAWDAKVLTGYHKQLATWPEYFQLELDHIGRILFCHASPRNTMDIFTVDTPEEKLLPIFSNLKVDVVICGHTHMQFDRKIGQVRVVNAGSVGMPFGMTGAFWVELGLDIKHRHLQYDLQNAAEIILSTDYPLADEFVEKNVLSSPTINDVMIQLRKAEIK